MIDGLQLTGMILAALAHVAWIGMLLWRRSGQSGWDGATSWLLWTALSTVVWALAPAVQTSVAGGVAWLEPGADALRYGGWLGLLMHLLRTPHSDAGWVSVRRWALGVVGAAGVAWAALWPSPLPFTLLSVTALVLLEQFYRRLADDARWSARPFCLALLGLFLFDFYLFSEATLVQAFDSEALATRGYVHALMVPLMMLTGARQRHWQPRLQVSRQLAFHTLALSLAGAYLLFIAGLGYYVRFVGGTWGGVLQTGMVFVGGVGLLAIFLSGTLRAKVRVWLGKNFFRYRYDYREEWLRFTRAVSSHTQPQDLAQNVIQGLAAMVESPAGALWMMDAQRQDMRQVARWNFPAVDATEPAGSALLAFMARTGWVINLAEWRNHADRYPGLTLPDWLQATPQAWLIVPLRIAGDDVGFVMLDNPRTRWDINWEVTDLLKTAATQAAAVLAQMQATEALMESRKFDSFNRMSAFVVHDLKNIVTQLSLMMKNARRLKDNPEFQEDMLMTVENALERMKQLMLQLREGAAPAAGGGAGVDLSDIARQWAESARQRGRDVELNLQAHVTARGHDERLSRVIGHLIQNALDATEQIGHQVRVVTLRFGSHACLRVEDNGVGMSDEFIKSRLFKPFQTTKQSGMGIGAFESAQYIQELGGKLTVESKEGQGTTITLTLPLLDTSSDSSHPRSQAS